MLNLNSCISISQIEPSADIHSQGLPNDSGADTANLEFLSLGGM